MTKVSKEKFTRFVGNKLGTTHKDGKRVVGVVLDSIKECLQDGEKIILRDFGSFEIRSYGERNGRNPKTGEKLIIPPSKTVLFRAGKTLKNEVSKND